MTAPRDAFGRLLVPIDELPREYKLEITLRAAGEMQALGGEIASVGRAIARCAREGGDLNRALGLRPPRGSHATPQALARRSEINAALVRLAAAVGAPRASRILRSMEPVPRRVAPLVESLQALRAPTSEAAISRARRLSRDRR